MYEYKFIKVKIGSLNGKPKENYEEIIKEQASEGWRLHTLAPLPFAAAGQANELELIFERLVQ
ncbi:DUF4177 domain-containing protein [Gracilibacillus caseinilyticus]|uniref:DUF4177 domain-containing protein n=1 Tax=Gracilibacillus caseinilyticus TaxID=2932256 RepID=A0ABY4EZF3_9BACI|nr:DUF4177 domain-containing protein [Gracilibacillus caseinilyticus]UOQ49792.1 DUF4177 domain-containing protein [Gracilibacillus caseinilyticus]